MNYRRQDDLPYPQPWEWIKDNIQFLDNVCFYIDVGANDGLIVSNTAYFDLNLGWKGICIEPHPRAYSQLVKNRPNSKNLNICISDEEGEVDFCAVNGYAEMLSGIEKCYHPEHIKRIQSEIERHGGNKKLIKIISKPLKQVFYENKVKKVDYLSIDTEGSEMDILRSIDFDSVSIKVISTENSSKSDIRGFLNTKGFVFVGTICADEIYYNDKI
jgi:FkbM family methyltransferase